MSRKSAPRTVVLHADESCLGNGAEGKSPGGAGALIEIESKGTIIRRDVFISAPDTTNNRMALCGAIAALALLAQKGHRLDVVYVSDSEYLVKGMNEWLPGWKARGWKRKGGKIENLELWQTLDRTVAEHAVRWEWVRGHAGHPKNEYADHLAVRAATHQQNSDGVVVSEFEGWLADRQKRKKFTDYDADLAFADRIMTTERHT